MPEYGDEGAMGRRPIGTLMMFSVEEGLEASTVDALTRWTEALGDDCAPMFLVNTPALFTMAKSANTVGWKDGEDPGQTVVNIDAEGFIVRSMTLLGMNADLPLKWVDEAVLHEMGHALGLNHSENPDDVMYPSVHGRVGLSDNDILRIRALYECDREVP